MKLKRQLHKLLHNGILQIVDEQNLLIGEQKQMLIDLYNNSFNINQKSSKNITVYGGPIASLKKCKAIKLLCHCDKHAKNLIEVAEYNGFNNVTYYYYFDKSAKILFPEIDKEIIQDKGELYKKENRKTQRVCVSAKTVKPKGV